MNNKTILFSGRFDTIHTGHIITIKRLGQTFKKVIVCILDYPGKVCPTCGHVEGGQFYSIGERRSIMKDALENVEGNYEIIVNKHHFGRITQEQVEELPHFDVYGSGNYDCFMHMHTLGYEHISVPRYPHYTASDDVNQQKFKSFIEREGYIK
ncbi:MAG: hypothetical protein GY861_12700 [bacterium]|nr:hypothetical protein [bacterium]